MHTPRLEKVQHVLVLTWIRKIQHCLNIGAKLLHSLVLEHGILTYHLEFAIIGLRRILIDVFAVRWESSKHFFELYVIHPTLFLEG